MDKARGILRLFYLPEMIYLRDVVSYSMKERLAKGLFCVPASHTYCCQPLKYVTASQHLMCLSQLAYTLLGFLAQDKAFDFVEFTTFKQLMAECKMWFRKIHYLHFLKNVQKGTEFELVAKLKRVNKIGSFVACNVEFSGAVRGKIEFVAPLKD